MKFNIYMLKCKTFNEIRTSYKNATRKSYALALVLNEVKDLDSDKKVSMGG